MHPRLHRYSVRSKAVVIPVVISEGAEPFRINTVFSLKGKTKNHYIGMIHDTINSRTGSFKPKTGHAEAEENGYEPNLLYKNATKILEVTNIHSI